jgi:hypothetical protein
VSGKYLKNHVNATVRLTAKVLQINGATAVVEASDGEQVSCPWHIHQINLLIAEEQAHRLGQRDAFARE